MSKLDEILDNKLTEITPDLEVPDGKEKGVKPVNTDNPEQTKDGSDPKDKKQETKENSTHDESGLLILKNNHLHGMAQNLHSTMHSVGHMQDTMGKMLNHIETHTGQTKLHEDVLMKHVQSITNLENAVKGIIDHLNKKQE